MRTTRTNELQRLRDLVRPHVHAAIRRHGRRLGYLLPEDVEAEAITEWIAATHEFDPRRGRRLEAYRSVRVVRRLDDVLDAASLVHLSRAAAKVKRYAGVARAGSYARSGCEPDAASIVADVAHFVAGTGPTATGVIGTTVRSNARCVRSGMAAWVPHAAVLLEMDAAYLPIGGPDGVDVTDSDPWADPVAAAAPSLHADLAARIARADPAAAADWLHAIAPLAPPPITRPQRTRNRRPDA